jgi:hypothetical protein
MIAALERRLDAAGRWLISPWAWPVLGMVTGALAVVAASVCAPVGDDVHLFGVDLFGPCATREATGLPCASCGMTRSWVWAARGEFRRAFAYHPAGALLFLVLAWGGLLGLVRLVLRRPTWMRLPWRVFAVMVGAWLVVWLGGWGARLAGRLPLPEDAARLAPTGGVP